MQRIVAFIARSPRRCIIIFTLRGLCLKVAARMTCPRGPVPRVISTCLDGGAGRGGGRRCCSCLRRVASGLAGQEAFGFYYALLAPGRQLVASLSNPHCWEY
jgi:hypothetical protein